MKVTFLPFLPTLRSLDVTLITFSLVLKKEPCLSKAPQKDLTILNISGWSMSRMFAGAMPTFLASLMYSGSSLVASKVVFSFFKRSGYFFGNAAGTRIERYDATGTVFVPSAPSRVGALLVMPGTGFVASATARTRTLSPPFWMFETLPKPTGTCPPSTAVTRSPPPPIGMTWYDAFFCFMSWWIVMFSVLRHELRAKTVVFFWPAAMTSLIDLKGESLSTNTAPGSTPKTPRW